jgi:hypothetical protein
MKTAMQELRDDLAQIFHDNKIPLYLDIGKYLEKEKEQIIEAYGTAIIMFYESEQPEEYYNNTYNQNK